MAASIMLAAFFMHENDASQHQSSIIFRCYLIISRDYLGAPGQTSNKDRCTKIVHPQNITDVSICNLHGHARKMTIPCRPGAKQNKAI
ncbi:MAG: hypothetical protein RSF79_23755 [Janthinobacterium sp.]